FVADGSQCVLLGLSEQLLGDKAFGAQGFRYCGSLLGPLDRGFEEIIAKLEGILQTMTQEFHLVGVNGMDFILREGEIYPIEVNPRYTASMELIERRDGLCIFDLHVEACLGKLPFERSNLKLKRSKTFFGKAILFAGRDLFVKGTEGWWQKGVRDIPFEGDWIGRGKPICTIFAEGRNREECYGALVELARTLLVSFATSS
ncbi:MAG: ATP-grasp domain-containing protein, partial [Candidatus Methylomirabilales bacterium]